MGQSVIPPIAECAMNGAPGEMDISVQMTHPRDFLPIHKRMKWWLMEARTRRAKRVLRLL